jgi:endonuclease YncB( thermonuclease family)
MTFPSMRGRVVQALLLGLALAVNVAHAQLNAISGAAVVIDGDTLDVAGVRVRLWGIDAPESRQVCTVAGQDYPCGGRATQHLRALVGDRPVACEPRTTDRYGRTVALCRVEGRDLGAAMVRDGWAVAFVRYSLDYVAHEQEARTAKRGLWEGTFTAPEIWRRKG